MLKQVLLTLAGAVLFLILVCAGVLFWAQRSGAARQEAFFKAVESGEAAEVLALCDPALREQIDEPVLAAWTKEVRARLGDFQGLSKTEFETTTKVTTDGQVTESKGSVNFSSGSAHSVLVFRNNLLVRFSIDSDRIPDGWFQGLPDSTLYRTRGEKFLTLFLNNDVDGAFAMMHEKLQEAVPRDKLKNMIEGITSKAGPMKSMKFEKEEFITKDGENLTTHYLAQCENVDLAAEVTFRFVGLKGHITSFNVKGHIESENKPQP